MSSWWTSMASWLAPTKTEIAMAASGSIIKELCEETTCPVCLEYFTDPVITECGHNFCRACLIQSWGDPGTDPSCPECREPVQQNNLRPSRKLANIAELSKKSNIQKMEGNEGEEGACEMHQEPLNLFCRDDKAPICVVCKKSKEHREHQVITLEEAAKEFKTIDSARGACVRHQKPLKLFCKDDEVPICVVCDQEHGKHKVIPVEEADEEYKKKIQDFLQSLKKKRENIRKQNMAAEQKSQKQLKQLEEDKQKITSFFKFLKEEESRLADVEKDMRNWQEENLTRLSKEISYFNDLIKDVEEKYQQPPSSFLHDIRGTLNRCQAGQSRQSSELPSGLEWRFKKYSLKMSVFKKVKEEFEGSLLCPPQNKVKGEFSPVSVTLDPNTANYYLVISADLKSVSWGAIYQSLPSSAERFQAMHCVMGYEKFTSGKHCWEVEVEPLKFAGEQWAVGVARGSVQKDRSISFSPSNGIWAVGKESSSPHAVWAYNSPKNTLLTSGSHELRRIWVFLDCNEGRVEFVDADTDNWLYSFPPASFSGMGIRPFFWVSTAGAKLKC